MPAASSTVYWPSCVVRLAVRLDEAYETTADAMPEAVTVQQLVSAQQVSASQKARRATRPPPFTQPSSDGLTLATERIPKKCTVEEPGLRQAGKFSLTIDFSDLNVDPRQVRAIGAEIHMGAVSPDDFARGMAGVDPTTGRASVLKTRINGDVNLDTLQLQGSVDTISWDHSERISEVHLEGRDLRGILLDSPADPRQLAALKLNRPITNVVIQILNQHRFFQLVPDPGTTLATALRGNAGSIRVEFISSEWADNSGVPLAPGVVDGATRIRLGADGQRGQGTEAEAGAYRVPAGDNRRINFWDIIVNYCTVCGAVPFFIGQTLWVRRISNLLDVTQRGYATQNDPVAQRRPFRDVGLGDFRGSPADPIVIRRLVFGENMLDMKLERKIGGITIPGVQAFSTHVDGGRGKDATGISNRLRWAAWPPSLEKILRNEANPDREGRDAVRTKVSPSGHSASEVLRIYVPGIADHDRLQQVARAVHEEIAHQEISGSFTTGSLASMSGDNGDPDMLRIHPGDPVQLIIKKGFGNSTNPVPNEMLRYEGMTKEAEADVTVKRLGLTRDQARTAARQRKDKGVPVLETFFRIKDVKKDWDAGSGIKVAAGFQNYVEARTGVSKSPEPPVLTGSLAAGES